jgi:hypothetical protein
MESGSINSLGASCAQHPNILNSRHSAPTSFNFQSIPAMEAINKLLPRAKKWFEENGGVIAQSASTVERLADMSFQGDKYEIVEQAHFRTAPEGAAKYAYVLEDLDPQDITPGATVHGKDEIVWIVEKTT